MKIAWRRPLLRAVVACAALLCACGSSRVAADAASSPAGGGGTAGDGGTTGAAGTAGLSGSTGGAGATGIAGAAGDAGRPPHGGSAGSAGAGGTKTGGGGGGAPAGAAGGAGAGGAGAGGADTGGGATGDLAKLNLFYLDVTGGRVLTANAQNPAAKVLVASAGQGPDGVAVDVAGGHVYWTGMGNPSANDGFIKRSNLDGSGVQTLVPAGGTYTPKQMKLDVAGGKMYWSDREGMRVMRSNLDGSNIDALVTTGQTASDRMDESRWCVGIALDLARGYIYWSQKGPSNGHVGTLRRAHLSMPAGRPPSPEPTSRCSTTSSPSRSTSIWISAPATSIGPTAPTTRSTGRRSRFPPGPPPRPAPTGKFW